MSSDFGKDNLNNSNNFFEDKKNKKDNKNYDL